MPCIGCSRSVAEVAFDPRQRRVAQPVGTDAVSGDPFQLPADALPEGLVVVGADGVPVVVSEDHVFALAVRVTSLRVLDQFIHQGAGYGLFAYFPLFPQPDCAVLLVQVAAPEPQNAATSAGCLGVLAQDQGVERGVPATSLISATWVELSARRRL